MENPKKAIDAIVAPKALTLGQIALLEKIDSPLLRGDYSKISETAKALWLLSLPIEKAVREYPNAEELATLWLNGISIEEYRKRLADGLDAIVAFFAMLPRPEDSDKKKGTETAG